MNHFNLCTCYFSNLILHNGHPSQYLFAGGYVSFSSDTMNGYHYYIQDYMGNNRMVVNGQTGATEQVTHYYPYGGVIGDISTNESLQAYKFEGKELDRTFGLDWYDIQARQYDAIGVPGWNKPDQLAEKYYGISPYVMCAGNPVNMGDYDGKKVLFADGTSNEFKEKFGRLVTYMNKCGTSSELANLESSNVTYYIQESEHVVDNEFQVQDGIATICINLDEGLITTKGIYMSPATCAGHEFGHADSYDKAIHGKGQYLTAKGHPENADSQYGSKEEKRNIEQTEQKMARKHNEIKTGQTTREDHTHIGTQKFKDGQSFEEMSQECRNHNNNKKITI